MGLPIAIFWPASRLFMAAHSHTLGFEMTWSSKAILALIAGVLVLVRPKHVHLILAAYLIILGLLEIVRISF